MHKYAFVFSRRFGVSRKRSRGQHVRRRASQGSDSQRCVRGRVKADTHVPVSGGGSGAGHANQDELKEDVCGWHSQQGHQSHCTHLEPPQISTRANANIYTRLTALPNIVCQLKSYSSVSE